MRLVARTDADGELEREQDDERRDPQPVGPLVDDPAGRLSLPRGFAYTVIAYIVSRGLAKASRVLEQ